MLPILTPKPQFFDVDPVLLHNFVTLKCRICIPKNQPGTPPPKKNTKSL